MNKILFTLFLALLISVGWSQTYYNGTDQRVDIPTVLENDYVSEFVVDVFLDSGETGYSRAYDIAKLPIVMHDTGNGSAPVQVLGLGRAMYSCYDASDETGTDSVKAYFYTQISDYAANGIVPFLTKSDVWATLHTDSVIAVSAAGAIAETERAVTLGDEGTRFVRWKITNTSTSLIDEPRCRIYWTMKKKNL